MGWCFAIINGRLAEIFFEPGKRKPKIIGHAYVKREEYKTKKEQKYIEEDTAKFRMSYRNGKYKRLEWYKRGTRVKYMKSLVNPVPRYFQIS